MNYEHGKYYKAELVGVRYVSIGDKGAKAIQFCVRMEDGTQDCVNKYLSGGAKQYTEEALIDLGCEPSDIRGADWLKKINAKLGGMAVITRCKHEEGYAPKLDGIYKPKMLGEEIGGDSPFGSDSPARNEFGSIPVDDLPF